MLRDGRTPPGDGRRATGALGAGGGRLPRLAGLAVLVGAYSYWVATTRPFTDGADLSVATGFVLVGLVGAAAMWRRRHDGSDKPAASERDRPPDELGLGHRDTRLWWAVVALIIALEIAGYAGGFVVDRAAFPTLSSLYDAASRSTAGKATIVFVWMVLGWGLFRR